MGITPLYKGNAPLMHFKLTTDSSGIAPVAPALASDSSGSFVKIYDAFGERNGAGTFLNWNPAAGTTDYLSSPFDTANVGVSTWWFRTTLVGETAPRDFDPQKVLIEDITQA